MKMSENHIEEIINNIEKQVNKLKSNDANEAETRLKIIDDVIFGILGWTKDDVEVEQRVSEDGNTTYCDYIIKTVSSALIIEAKKIGVVFNTVERDYKMKLTKSAVSGDLGDAIIQAREYCRKLSVPFAIVTNGLQWIIFPANRIDQVSFHSSYAIVFNSLIQSLKKDFDEFYGLLSRESVINSSLEHNLLGENTDQIEERRLKNLVKKSYTKTINPMYPPIEDAITTAFSQAIIQFESNLFERCYVNTPERIKFDKKISMYLSRSQHLFSNTPVRPLRKKESNIFKQSLVDAHKKSKPLSVIILGTVGAGKTTFLHYTRNISAAELFKKEKNKLTPHWINIDFLKHTDDKKPIDFIYESIFEYIINDEYLNDYTLCIKDAYADEIAAIKKGPGFLIASDQNAINIRISDKLMADYENKIPFVNKILTYITKKTAVFLAVDNVDQLPEDIQSTIFTDCISLSQKINLKLIMSLRSSTYIEHRNSPSFNAFEFDPILIEPPQIESVLSKRFNLAKNIVDGTSADFVAENGIKVHVDNSADIINLVQSSVLGTEVGSLLEVLAAGDVRNALKMTRQFIEHGYTNPGKAINTYQMSGSYVLPRHEAFRAILLGTHSVYSEEYSLVGNPFDARLGKTALQSLRLFILSALVQYSSDPQFEYIEGEKIRSYLRKIGVGDKESLQVLSDLCQCRFINTATPDQPNFASSFFPTRLGGYIIRDLIANFTFLECTLMDTFIAKDSTWENIKKFDREIINCSTDIVKRLEFRTRKTICFFDYMESLYLSLHQEAIRRNLPKEWKSNPFKEIRTLLENNLKKALESARKNYE